MTPKTLTDMAQTLMKAFAYCRTSSAANVGNEKDSELRQLATINAHAARAGIEIVGVFYDAAVSGADAVTARPGFVAMMERIAADDVRMIVVETASRFARDLMVQEVGFTMLRGQGVDLVAADSPWSFLDDGPTSRLIRQVLGAVSEFEKAMVVSKLKGARDRKRAAEGKCEGRKSIAERDGGDVVVAEARRLHRRNPKTGKRRSLRDIAAELATLGHLSSAGTPYSTAVVARMVAA